MKTQLFSRFILMAGIVFLSHNLANSQVLQVTSDITPEDMVEILIGSGLEYSNVMYTGNDISRGSFWGGPGNIGVGNGIILTSGNVNVAPGPNNSGSAGTNSGQGGDPDLSMIAGVSTFDACVLEFDFVPEFIYVWFQYVFCSEEYHEYVNQFNDAFGFFISGPGVNGPYSNNSVNLARIPSTNIPVSINTVNCGNPYNCAQSCMNCQYFVNNTNYQFTQYDAFTTVLTAWAELEPMQTYHIKLAIGDGVDHAYDSGVFLQASSFCSGPSTRIGKPAEKDSDDSYRIYPVPAGEVLNITNVDGQRFDIQLSGQDGRIWKSVSGEASMSIDISPVPPGIYILRITGPDGVSTRKICVK